jgi:hypothetical protein
MASELTAHGGQELERDEMTTEAKCRNKEIVARPIPGKGI